MQRHVNAVAYSHAFLLVNAFLTILTTCVPLRPARAAQPVAQRGAMRQDEPAFVPDEVLVLLSADANRNGILEAGEKLDGVENAIRGQIRRRITLTPGRQVLRVKLPAGKSVRQAMAERWSTADPRVLVVEPNYIVHALAVPNDSRYPEMWALNNTGQTGGTPDADIDAPQAWDVTTGSSAVVVAVIDTGVDYLHPELIDNMWHNPGESGGGKETNGIDDDNNGFIDDVYGWDFAQDDQDPSDAHSHGTHVSGTIAGRGNNALGVTGVNWQCRIMACRFLNASGSGSTADAVDAINYAVANGAKILSNSWGGGSFSSSLEAAIINAYNQGVLFVAAAGNSASDNDTVPAYPANYNVPNVISVAATTSTDALASFSSYGDMTVHLGAPGLSVLSSVPNYVTLFYEDFQSAATPGFAGTLMTTEGPVNRWGTVANTVFTGNISARGDYANASPYLGGSDGSIVTPAMETRGLRGLSLVFSYRFETGTTDALTAEVWDGAGWRTVFTVNGNCCLGAFYYSPVVDIPEAYRNAAMKVRFHWITDVTDNNYYGGEIDGILVQSIGTSYADAYALFSGTSMATPHVSGVAALLLANNPTMNLSDLKQRIVFTGDPIPALAGKTISGRRLNAYQALTAPPGAAVFAPNGGEPWAKGTTHQVIWTSIGGGPTADVFLLKGGSVHSQLADDIPNTGNFTWSISTLLPTATNYRVRITDGVNVDESDADFSLLSVHPIWSQDFEAGTGGVVIDNTFAPGGGLWHLSSGRGSGAGHSPTMSLYYGQGENSSGGGNYDVGDTAGVVTSPPISLFNSQPPVTLSFNYFLSTEGAAPTWDVASVEVSQNNGPFSLVAANGGAPQSLSDQAGSWQKAQIDVSSLAGSSIRVRFRFATNDAIANNFEGWYMDDVQLAGRIQIGDFDNDLDVDIEDFAHLQLCMGSPVQSPPECIDARLDGDPDVDSDDVRVFLRCMSGPNIPANIDCANQ